jgi:hypothetical protein
VVRLNLVRLDDFREIFVVDAEYAAVMLTRRRERKKLLTLLLLLTCIRSARADPYVRVISRSAFWHWSCFP